MICSYPNCKTKCLPYSAHSFFNIPKDFRQNLWLKHSGDWDRLKNDIQLKKYRRFCELHFYPKHLLILSARKLLNIYSYPKPLNSSICSCNEFQMDPACMLLTNNAAFNNVIIARNRAHWARQKDLSNELDKDAINETMLMSLDSDSALTKTTKRDDYTNNAPNTSRINQDDVNEWKEEITLVVTISDHTEKTNAFLNGVESLELVEEKSNKDFTELKLIIQSEPDGLSTLNTDSCLDMQNPLQIKTENESIMMEVEVTTEGSVEEIDYGCSYKIEPELDIIDVFDNFEIKSNEKNFEPAICKIKFEKEVESKDCTNFPPIIQIKTEPEDQNIYQDNSQEQIESIASYTFLTHNNVMQDCNVITKVEPELIINDMDVSEEAIEYNLNSTSVKSNTIQSEKVQPLNVNKRKSFMLELEQTNSEMSIVLKDHSYALLPNRKPKCGVIYPIKSRSQSNSRFKCIKCNVIYLSMDTLKQHIRTDHESKSFKCELCDTYFEHLQLLITHMEDHNVTTVQSNDHSFECKTCENKFPSFKLLNVHKSKSHGRKFKIYKCKQKACNSTFKHKHEQRAHMHDFTKLNLCDKSYENSLFAYNPQFNISNKQYYCHICKESFRSFSVCSSHLKRMHADNIKCDHCPAFWPTKLELYNHLLQVYPKDE